MELRISFFVLMLLLLSAWNWPTHKAFASKVYDGFPEEFQNNLNLTLIQDGSIIPDSIFKDYSNHSYPNSVDNVDYWLKKSVANYGEKDYANASIEFGIASHYISDSFSAPHNVNGEDYRDHLQFETEAEGVPFFARCSKGNKDADYYLARARLSRNDWELWKLNHDRNAQSLELSRALESAHSIFHMYFGEKCNVSLLERFRWFFRLWAFRVF